MGSINQQEIPTGAVRIVAGVPAYVIGVWLASVVRLSDGVYQLNFASPLNANEQLPTLTVCGTDPTADAQLEIVGGGPRFTALNVRTYVADTPADVDVYVLIEKIRVINDNSGTVRNARGS